MPDGVDNIVARTVSSIEQVDAADWDHLANPDPATFNPFVSHAFLSALEQSKSVAPEQGWEPMHLLVEVNGALIGAAPLFAKGHSQGEYVFDHHWADAYARHGHPYYPKLLCAAPFTPVPGPRLLAKGQNEKQLTALALKNAVAQTGVSSCHINFIQDDDREALLAIGFLPRIGEQFHWRNRGYQTFDDFLSELSSRKRKAIRRERRDAISSGISIKRLRGVEITEQYWDAFWRFYQDTGARKWGYPYLTRTFFRLISERMPEHLLFIVAERGGTPIGGALNFVGGNTLYGRYWGCDEAIAFLHFEVCYYQAIEFAIEAGLQTVEAGAQGQHKIARGYEPIETHSAHWIENPDFRSAIAQYLEAERRQTGSDIHHLQAFTPFRKTKE